MENMKTQIKPHYQRSLGELVCMTILYCFGFWLAFNVAVVAYDIFEPIINRLIFWR